MKFILYTILLFFITLSCYKLMTIGITTKWIPYTYNGKYTIEEIEQREAYKMIKENYINPIIGIIAYSIVVITKILYDNSFNNYKKKFKINRKVAIWIFYIIINLVYYDRSVFQFNVYNDSLIIFENSLLNSIREKLPRILPTSSFLRI